MSKCQRAMRCKRVAKYRGCSRLCSSCPCTGGARVLAAAEHPDKVAPCNWMWNIDHGLADLETAASVRAASRFIDAIHEIEPYRGANRRLMALMDCELALGAAHQQARYAEAEPLAKWALSVRVADRYARPEAVFQCLFTLGRDRQRRTRRRRRAAVPARLRSRSRCFRKATSTRSPRWTPWRRCSASRGSTAKPRGSISARWPSSSSITPDENLDLAYTAEQYAINLRRMNRADEAQSWEVRVLKIRDQVAAEQFRARAMADALRHDLQAIRSSRRTGVAARQQ